MLTEEETEGSAGSHMGVLSGAYFFTHHSDTDFKGKNLHEEFNLTFQRFRSLNISRAAL